jgi:hypothetical protein
MISMNHYHFPDNDTAERLRRIEHYLGLILKAQETLLMSFEDLKAAQDATDAKIDSVKADIETLMSKLAAIPVPGMTPEQEAALADAVAHAQAINDKLGAIDAMNP